MSRQQLLSNGLASQSPLWPSTDLKVREGNVGQDDEFKPTKGNKVI